VSGAADDARRDLDIALEAGDRVGVTGASGFIGSSVVRVLMARGVSVVALVEPGADPSNLDGLDVEHIDVDVRDAERVARAVRGCRAVFHVARCTGSGLATRACSTRSTWVAP
jgi:nucleoside-diphosphate-sugar epimerase